LTSEDLKTLLGIYEGWYVEYKRKATSPKNISKSISSFANKDGGWVFYGVENKSGELLPESFPGIPSVEVPQTLEKIREAASAHIRPALHYDYKVIDGPHEELGLHSGNSIVAVFVPLGLNAPYIISDGRIYIRVGDQSLTQEFSVSESESENVYLHLFIMPDPIGERDYRSKITFNDFSELMKNKEYGWCSYDNLFTMNNGYIARGVHGNDPYLTPITFRYYMDCSTIITVPINSTKLELFQTSLFKPTRNYEQTKEFIRVIKENNLLQVTIFDVNYLLAVLFRTLIKHRILLQKDELKGPFWLKYRLEGLWRKIPFLDAPEYIQYIQSLGLPVIQYNKVMGPGSDMIKHLAKFDCVDDFKFDKSDLVNSSLKVTGQTLKLFIDILLSIGLSTKYKFLKNIDWVNFMKLKNNELKE
jgi:hypothetical protein